MTLGRSVNGVLFRLIFFELLPIIDEIIYHKSSFIVENDCSQLNITCGDDTNEAPIVVLVFDTGRQLHIAARKVTIDCKNDRRWHFHNETFPPVMHFYCLIDGKKIMF